MNSNVKKWVHMVAFLLVVVGAVNLGLFGIMPADSTGEGFDLLQRIFGFSPTLLELIDVLIGVSGIYLLVTHAKQCTVCETSKLAK